MDENLNERSKSEVEDEKENRSLKSISYKKKAEQITCSAFLYRLELSTWQN